MSEFDDLRGLLDEDEDEFDDFSFDDVVDDGYDYGQEIGAPSEFAGTQDERGPVNKFLSALVGGMSAQQRLLISIMLFGNVAILSAGMLLATGRIG